MTMPDEPENPTGQEGQQPPPAQPAYVNNEDFNRFQGMIEGRFNEIGNTIAQAVAQLNNRPAAPAHAEPEVSAEELEQALSEGKGADKFMRAVDSRMRKLEGTIRTRLDEIESSGIGAISEVVGEVVRPQMPYYNRYKKEVDAYIASLPAHLRIKKDVHLVAYNAVAGSHVAEIVKEEREKVLREAADPNAAGAPGGAGGRQQNGTVKDAAPTVADLFGKDASDALTAIGRTPDQHAQRMGHKDWGTYAAWVKEQEKANA